ncbi:hypothetical protein Pcac1_g10055 [Phytophthora cactorum]|nr:hypothetical protein Pcac1_g10055 [Phytophthora cactorum]
MATAGPNDQGNTRKHILEGVQASLRFLELEYVDVIFCHRPDLFTQIKETVRAMNYVINKGWAFYWGTSESPPSQIHEACEIADRLNQIRRSTTSSSAQMLSTRSSTCTKSTGLVSAGVRYSFREVQRWNAGWLSLHDAPVLIGSVPHRF